MSTQVNKHMRTHIERIEKFLSQRYFEDVNLFGRSSLIYSLTVYSEIKVFFKQAFQKQTAILFVKSID